MVRIPPCFKVAFRKLHVHFNVVCINWILQTLSSGHNTLFQQEQLASLGDVYLYETKFLELGCN